MDKLENFLINLTVTIGLTLATSAVLTAGLIGFGYWWESAYLPPTEQPTSTPRNSINLNKEYKTDNNLKPYELRRRESDLAH